MGNYKEMDIGNIKKEELVDIDKLIIDTSLPVILE